jgi:hypothetical protein
MSDLGNRPALKFVGSAKATLANVLSARFPMIRRTISYDLNHHDRIAMLLASYSLRVSINSQDHLKPFADYFTGRCDAKIPKRATSAYDSYLKYAEWLPCTNDDSHSTLKLCEGPEVLKNSPCNRVQRAVCYNCACHLRLMTEPGGYHNRLPNFGVTPLCDTCIAAAMDYGKECKCTGLPLEIGQRHERDLWLCFECRIAYHLEQLQYADDMARAFLYMKKNKSTNLLEYHPATEIKRAKLPTCPCGNARFRTKSKASDAGAPGMCVFCAALKISRLDEPCSVRYPETALERAENMVPDQVLTKDAITALHTQIKKKGLPPPLTQSANKYWGYTGVTGEPRLLDYIASESYEDERRELKSNRQSLNWNDREGFLRNFRWPYAEHGEGGRLTLGPLGVCGTHFGLKVWRHI